MPVIKPASLRDLKTRVGIVDVVSRVVTLKKAGARYKGLCPFHTEKSPSFHVDAEKGFFKCFGCGKAGDVITFVQETEHLNFSEAVETLAGRFGFPLEYEEGSGAPKKEDRSLRQEIYAIHEQAADFYHRAFRATDAAGEFIRNYWTGPRKFTLEVAEDFKIGLSPSDGGGLAGELLKKGFSEESIRLCGLFFVRDGPLVLGGMRSRFRGRLMIPIRDHQGRIVAFTARQTEITPRDTDYEEGKYVNSPETPIFKKSDVLFNLDRARKAASEGKPFILVEGQLDAIRCWHTGLTTAVAPQGTSITEGQLALMRRYQSEVECFLDGDFAGQKAALRFLPMALKASLEVKFLVLAKGEDPDSLFRDRGLAAYEEIKTKALNAMGFACRAALPEPSGASAEQKSRAVSGLCELILQVDSEVVRSEFLTQVASYFSLPAVAVQKDFSAVNQRDHRQASVRPNPQSPPPSPASSPNRSAESDLLYLSLHFEQLGPSLASIIQHDWVDAGTLDGRLLNRVLAEFEHGTWPGRNHMEGLLETAEEKTLIATLLFEAPSLDDPIKVANEGIRSLFNRHLERELRALQVVLAEAGSEGKADQSALLVKQHQIRRQLLNPPKLPVAL